MTWEDEIAATIERAQRRRQAEQAAAKRAADQRAADFAEAVRYYDSVIWPVLNRAASVMKHKGVPAEVVREPKTRLRGERSYKLTLRFGAAPHDMTELSFSGEVERGGRVMAEKAVRDVSDAVLSADGKPLLDQPTADQVAGYVLRLLNEHFA